MLLAPGSLRSADAQRLLQVSGAKRSISLTVAVGKTEDVRIDMPFTDITIGDSEVADISPLTDRTLSILGKKIGATRVTLYGEGKTQIGIFDIEVTYDVTRLATEIAHFSDGGIKVSSVNGRIMLSGTARDAATLDRAMLMARQFAPDPIDTVMVSQAQQVMLEVRFVEATRQASRALGVQWNSFGQNTLTNVGSGLPPSQLPVTQLLRRHQRSPRRLRQLRPDRQAGCLARSRTGDRPFPDRERRPREPTLAVLRTAPRMRHRKRSRRRVRRPDRKVTTPGDRPLG